MTAPTLSEAIDAELEGTAFSGVVRVSRQGQVLYESARGFADRAHGIPNTMDTQLATASATKGFTALGMMSLVEDGALTLDTTVRSILGDVLELIDPAVTVEHLLGHTSGIGDYLAEDELEDINAYLMPVPVHQLAKVEDYLAVLRGHPMKFEPGTRFEYCNGGYVVLALVIEAVASSDYYDVLQERVFDRADMGSTGFLRYDELPGSAALGYLSLEGLRTNVHHLPVRGCGDGGAFSTVDDMDRFWAALLSGDILPSAIVDEIARPRHRSETPGSSYGLGFWLDPDTGTVILEGFDAGVSFRSSCTRDSGLVYTVISNTSDGAWPIAKLLDRALPELANP